MIIHFFDLDKDTHTIKAGCQIAGKRQIRTVYGQGRRNYVKAGKPGNRKKYWFSTDQEKALNTFLQLDQVTAEYFNAPLI